MKKDKTVKIDKSVKQMLKKRRKILELKFFKTYKEFGNKVYKIREKKLKKY